MNDKPSIENICAQKCVFGRISTHGIHFLLFFCSVYLFRVLKVLQRLFSVLKTQVHFATHIYHTFTVPLYNNECEFFSEHIKSRRAYALMAEIPSAHFAFR